MAGFKDLPFQDRGGKQVKEVLFHSKAGTGKTIGISANFVEICNEYPNTRILILRKTLKALRESWQVTFEQIVAPRYKIKVPSSTRKSRENYRFPNGSEIVLGGLDDPEKWRSTEWNIIWFVEGTEVTEKEFEEVTRGLRWAKGPPYNFKGLEVNPKSQFHWIYTRFFGDMTPEEVAEKREIVITPARVAFQCTFKDNPHYWDLDTDDFTRAGREYFEGNDMAYSGADHLRMVQGLWCADEGLVYPEFGLNTHVFDGSLRTNSMGRWELDLGKRGVVRVLGFFHSQDWGMDKPGCMQVWAVDEKQRMCLVREWYHTGWHVNVWAPIHYQQWRGLNSKQIIGDGAEPGSIKILNDLLSYKGNRDGDRIAIGATGDLKDRLMGRSLVRSKLAETRDGIPTIYFLKNALQHPPDPALKGLPKSTVQEFPGYVMEVDKEGMSKDVPTKKNDHGMDALKYAAGWFFNNPFTEDQWTAPGFHPAQWINQDDELEEAILEMYRERHNSHYGEAS